MKTTLEIPDPLFKRVKAQAAMKGLKLKDVVTSALSAYLAQPQPDLKGGVKPCPFPLVRGKVGGLIKQMNNQTIARLWRKRRILSATADLLDVNVWLALSVEGHSHHKAALKAWSGLARPGFCRLTQLGLLRLLCNPQVMGGAVLEPEAAWTAYEKLMASGVVEFVEEPDGLDARLKALTKGMKAARDFWTDTYLAAFAHCSGLRLVSFDSGFTRFREVDCLILEPDK